MVHLPSPYLLSRLGSPPCQGGLVRDHSRELGWLHGLGEKDPSSCSCPVLQGCNHKSRLKGEKGEGRDPPRAHLMASDPYTSYVAVAAHTVASLHV